MTGCDFVEGTSYFSGMGASFMIAMRPSGGEEGVDWVGTRRTCLTGKGGRVMVPRW